MELNEKLKKINELTAIRIPYIMGALGLPASKKCEAATKEEAYAELVNCFEEDDHDGEHAASMRFDELLLEEIQNATSVEDIRSTLSYIEEIMEESVFEFGDETYFPLIRKLESLI